ncbi:flagellar basal body L-ring protein FlgH [Vampirovibrio chlorellavorus]|uniref:flagellar basal body L-ring protein FlgH n=1 Tax=Vampirovibrio chlorellavorus TaxID=758823 RepID=UPI0026EC0860|nr:flagellar basal body L-ring protein FlgH [Vampirovibrio chlorellavorus]
MQSHSPQKRQSLQALWVGLLLLAALSHMASAPAESLFRASTTYTSQEPVYSRSLFTPPIARAVGDLVTIQINETTQNLIRSDIRMTKEQSINQNGSNLFNSMLGFMLGKLPFNTSRINTTLQAPNFNGLNNNNQMNSRAEINRTTGLVDTITCQVVQVLPNGDLMVQGQKTVQGSKERTDLVVTGIIKPYYLNRRNEISSNMVGNFQMMQGGKGILSRQQNDGIANKIYQFFN